MENTEKIPEFVGFPKIGRLSREILVTEKIDGTNGQIYIGADGEFLVGSKSCWITPENDNHGFAKWAYEHKEELMGLGKGRHFGEFWGRGINRNYGLKEKRFSLFNTTRWCLPGGILGIVSKDYDKQKGLTIRFQKYLPECVGLGLVPVIYKGLFSEQEITNALMRLRQEGSFATPNFLDPEGIVVFFTASGMMLKKTLKNDEIPKMFIKEES